MGTILLPGLLLLSGSPILFGWAKPVPVNPLNFSSLKKGELMVSAAGILANFSLALGATLLFHLLKTAGAPFMILGLLKFTVTINLILGIFNLFPIPPLDGSKILLSQLPYKLAREYQKLERYGFLLLLIFMMVPFGNSSLL